VLRSVLRHQRRRDRPVGRRQKTPAPQRCLGPGPHLRPGTRITQRNREEARL